MKFMLVEVFLETAYQSNGTDLVRFGGVFSMYSHRLQVKVADGRRDAIYRVPREGGDMSGCDSCGGCPTPWAR